MLCVTAACLGSGLVQEPGRGERAARGMGTNRDCGQYLGCRGLRSRCCLLSSCRAVKRLLVFNYITDAKDWRSY